MISKEGKHIEKVHIQMAVMVWTRQGCTLLYTINTKGKNTGIPGPIFRQSHMQTHGLVMGQYLDIWAIIQTLRYWYWCLDIS